MKINGCESSVGIGQLLAVVVLAVVMVVVVNTEFVDYFLFIWTFTRSQGAVAGKSLLMSELWDLSLRIGDSSITQSTIRKLIRSD